VIDDQGLLGYFHRGLIPGPEESEEAFLKRAELAKPLGHPEWSEGDAGLQEADGSGRSGGRVCLRPAPGEVDAGIRDAKAEG